MHWGQALVVLVIAVPFALRLLGTVRSARGGRQGRSQGDKRGGGWLAHRRALRLEDRRHEHARIRDEAKHRNRLAEQEAARQARAEAGPGPDGTSGGHRPRGGTVRSRVVRVGESAVPPSPQPGPSRPSGSPASSPPAPGAGQGAPPSRPAPGPASPQSSEGSTVSIAVPGAEQVVDGINTIAGLARAGNILAKRRAMLALIHLCERAASMALSLSRALAEPGMHYGPEVTEPIAKGAMHLTAAAMAFAEADTALVTLLRSSLAETMESGRQVPHHDELSETGAH